MFGILINITIYKYFIVFEIACDVIKLYYNLLFEFEYFS